MGGVVKTLRRSNSHYPVVFLVRLGPLGIAPSETLGRFPMEPFNEMNSGVLGGRLLSGTVIRANLRRGQTLTYRFFIFSTRAEAHDPSRATSCRGTGISCSAKVGAQSHWVKGPAHHIYIYIYLYMSNIGIA